MKHETYTVFHALRDLWRATSGHPDRRFKLAFAYVVAGGGFGTIIVWAIIQKFS